MDSDNLDATNALKPTILISISKGDVKEIDAQINLNDDNSAMFVGSVDKNIIELIGSAKGRISIAVKLMEEIYYENSVGSSGSTKNTKKLIEDCKIE